MGTQDRRRRMHSAGTDIADGDGEYMAVTRPSPLPSPAMEEDAQYRRAWGSGGNQPFGRRLRAAYYQYLPPAPSGRFVTRDQARVYLGLIQDAVARDQWTPRERESLRQLLRKWERRAAGKDIRFNAVGVQGGMNERNRKQGTADRIRTILDLIESFGGKGATEPGPKWTVDKAWPMGKPR